jgi:hypothetical protein
MTKLWNKYLVVRRDGTVPDWPYLVMSAADPAVPQALRSYAGKALELGMDTEYVSDIVRLATSFDEWRETHTTGDPDAPAHRPDDLSVISRIKAGSTPDGWRRLHEHNKPG